MTELYSAYADYLERMLDESDDLVILASETIPEWASIAHIQEWAELAWTFAP